MIAASLRENRAVSLASALGHTLDVESVRRWARLVERAGARLQTELGTREPPIALVDGDNGLAVRAVGIAGTLQLGGVEWTVVPKFVADATPGIWERSLIAMVGRARRSAWTPARRTGLGAAKLTFLDHVAIAFADALHAALAGDPIHTYRVAEVESPVLTGRLILRRQLNHLIARPHVFSCELDRLDSDNPFNNLLHWATAWFAQRTRTVAIRQRLRSLAEHLPTVHNPPQLPARLPLRVPPQYSQWANAVEIATLVALGRGLAPGGDSEGYGLLVEMASMWEGYVDASLRDGCARLDDGRWEVCAQKERLFAEALSQKTRSYWTRPDDVVMRDGVPILLVDAKYKLLADAEAGSPRRPLNADVYQLACSLVSHNCMRGLLVYPKVVNDVDLGDGDLRLWRVELGGRALLLGAVAVDVSNVASTASERVFDDTLGSHVRAVVEHTA